MERNRLVEPVPQTWSKMSQTWGGGSHQEFEYISDPYDSKTGCDRGFKATAVEKREKISNHDWRHVSQERRMKHEAMISDARNKETYPYLGGDKDEELEAAKQWMRSSASFSRSGGFSQERPQVSSESSFLAGRGRGLEDGSRSSRMTLPTIVQRLQTRLDLDWEGTTVVVSATDQDLVQVAFHMATVDSERGATAYMGVLSKDVDLIGTLGLRKVSQLWAMKRDFSAEMDVSGSICQASSITRDHETLENTWMFFLLMPKWVRMRPTDAYYTVHPRSQGSAFRMSTAGSSVLLSLGSSVYDSPRRNGPLLGDSVLFSAQSVPDKLKRAGGTMQTGAPDLIDLSLIEMAVGTLPSINMTRGTPT